MEHARPAARLLSRSRSTLNDMLCDKLGAHIWRYLTCNHIVKVLLCVLVAIERHVRIRVVGTVAMGGGAQPFGHQRKRPGPWLQDKFDAAIIHIVVLILCEGDKDLLTRHVECLRA